MPSPSLCPQKKCVFSPKRVTLFVSRLFKFLLLCDNTWSSLFLLRNLQLPRRTGPHFPRSKWTLLFTKRFNNSIYFSLKLFQATCIYLLSTIIFQFFSVLIPAIFFISLSNYSLGCRSTFSLSQSVWSSQMSRARKFCYVCQSCRPSREVIHHLTF